MESTKLWKEVLFLLIPLLAFCALSFMAGCGGVQGDPYAELHLSTDEWKVLEEETRSLPRKFP